MSTGPTPSAVSVNRISPSLRPSTALQTSPGVTDRVICSGLLASAYIGDYRPADSAPGRRHSSCGGRGRGAGGRHSGQPPTVRRPPLYNIVCRYTHINNDTARCSAEARGAIAINRTAPAAIVPRTQSLGTRETPRDTDRTIERG